MNNKIKFLENARKKFVAMPKNSVNDKSNNVNQSSVGLSTSPLASSSQRVDHNKLAIDTSTNNIANNNTKNAANNPRMDLQRRPIHLEGYDKYVLMESQDSQIPFHKR